MDMIHLIEKSGNLYPDYDYAHGYGIPQSSFFTNEENTSIQKQFHITIQNSQLVVTLLPTKITDSETVVKKTTDNYMYYHIMLPDGKLFKYGLITVSESKPLKIELRNIPDNATVWVLYRQYLDEWKNIK